jgi:ribonuclease HII
MSISIGIDEAGLGPIAGPIVAGVVALAGDLRIKGVMDSKKMTERSREALVDEIMSAALFWKTLVISHEVVDRLGPHEAWKLAIVGLAQAAHKEFPKTEIILDGNKLVGLDYVRPIVKADDKIPSVSAASVLAKYTQCCWMDDYHVLYPLYGFDRHRGYGTVQHLKQLMEHGPCPIHRKTFRPVKRASLVRRG